MKRKWTRIIALTLALIFVIPLGATAKEKTQGEELYDDLLEMVDLLKKNHINATEEDDPIKMGLIKMFDLYPSMYQSFVNFMFQSYDPYSYYLDASTHDAAFDSTTYVGGIGITMELKEDGAYIESLVSDGAAEKAGLKLYLGSYPITPATDVLHELSKHKSLGVMTVQCEDEISGCASALGASFAGALAVTSTSGPGVCLKSEAMNLVADAITELHEAYPDIRYHIYTGVAGDVMERLDNGLLDFGVLLQPVDIARYDSVALPAKDKWGVLMRRDNPLAGKDSVTPEDLKELPLICSRRDLRNKSVRNPYAEWFGGYFDKLNVVAVHNLVHNASLLVERGLGNALTLEPKNVVRDKLCFRPLNPPLESGSSIVWKKYQVFSRAAEAFLERIREKFGGQG